MRWKRRNPLGRFVLRESIDVDAPVERVFAHWNHYEAFPSYMQSVRRTKCIDAQRVLWDVDVGGHQVVWEAFIEEFVPEKLVRWKSRWGAENSGEVQFEPLADGRTRVCVEAEFRPRDVLESLGARLGVIDLHVRRDLWRFRQFVERSLAADWDESEIQHTR